MNVVTMAVIRRKCRHLRRLPGSRENAEAGIVETVVVLPLSMLVVLFVVQACLWAHADALVQSAAAEGDQAACDSGGSISVGIDQAKRFLAGAAHSTVVGPSVTATQPAAGQVELQVQGAAESVLPWIHLTVSAVRRGTVQQFRSSE